ncbi:hypothetical protein AAUPMC_01287, partial [Pasteurella multocida subsp. multocida str. Anand1_cattle]
MSDFGRFIRRQVVAIMPKRPIYYAVKSMTVYVLKRGREPLKDIVSGTRGELMEGARKALNTGPDSTAELGIEVVDVRVKQINLPDEVSSSIYQRMRAERDAVAREHRSQGREKAAFIQADVDRKVTL